MHYIHTYIHTYLYSYIRRYLGTYKLTHIHLCLYVLNYLCTNPFCMVIHTYIAQGSNMDVPSPGRPPGAHPPKNCPWPRFEKPQPAWYKPPLRICEPVGFAKLVLHARKLGVTAPVPWIEPPWEGDVPMPAFA